MIRNLFYIVEADFARPNACTNRVLNNIKAITSLHDWDVTIIGYGDVLEMTENNLKIRNVKRGKGFLVKLFYYVFRGILVKKLVKKGTKKIDLLIYYGCSSRFLIPLLQYARKNKTKIVVDVAEWYNYSHLPMGRFGLSALDVHHGMTKLIPKCDGAIVISSFLQDFYTIKNLKIIKVPVLIDTRNIGVEKISVKPFDENYFHLIYAGSPGKKDLVMNIIEAVEQLYANGLAILLHILGPTQKELELKTNRLFSDAIVFHGKISQQNVSEYLKQADFSVLLRPNERYAQAGFPTKFVESLNAGLPVIANNTSDLALYLKDGYNGFVVPDYSVDALIGVLKVIISIDKVKLGIMKINARQTAVENFDYHIYSNQFHEFFKCI